MQIRSLLSTGLLAALAITMTATPVSATPAPAQGSLLPLIGSAAERVQVADLVAAAKFPDQPITDPVREQQVLDMAAAQAPKLGLDPAFAVRFFRDQIEAAKVVEYGLFARWTAHPDQVPAHKPDLATEVRPIIDRINGELLGELADTAGTRAGRECGARLMLSVRVVELREHFDRLHREGLGRAVWSVCG